MASVMCESNALEMMMFFVITQRGPGRQDPFFNPNLRVVFSEQDAFSFEIGVPIRYE
jgi:hypothetical protein